MIKEIKIVISKVKLISKEQSKRILEQKGKIAELSETIDSKVNENVIFFKFHLIKITHIRIFFKNKLINESASQIKKLEKNLENFINLIKLLKSQTVETKAKKSDDIADQTCRSKSETKINISYY